MNKIRLGDSTYINAMEVDISDIDFDGKFEKAQIAFEKDQVAFEKAQHTFEKAKIAFEKAQRLHLKKKMTANNYK
jgi:glycine betaine/choline ABC-type transport system substrate-binding protein